MGLPYMPELAAWPAMVASGGMAAADYDVVENERFVNGEKVKVYEAADEKKVAVVDHSGTGTKVVRCVEYPVAAGPWMPATVLLFTVTEGDQGKEVAEVVEERPVGDGAALVLEPAGGECDYEESTGTWDEHMVDVQTDYEPTFIVQESVREDDDDGGSRRCFYDEKTGTWEHMVDVQTHYDTFIVQVSVREDDDGGDDDHIVCISRVN